MERIRKLLRIAGLFMVGIVLWTTSAGVGFSQSGSPTIETINVPVYGSKPAILRGQVSGVDPRSVRIAPLLFVSGLGWFSKPYCTETTVAVASDNTFTVPFWTGGVDETATLFALLLVPADAAVPCVSSAAGVPHVLEEKALAKLMIQRPNPKRRTISFSGEEFRVKAAATPVGPGPNRFSDSTESVFVDSDGALHLRLLFADGNWYSSEVYSARKTVYGRYTFTFVMPAALNPCAVFGAFTWAEAESVSREIDAIEVSQFCNAQSQNSQNVVQPFTVPGNLNRFQLPLGVPLTQEMIWEPDRIVFRTYIGDEAFGSPLNEWVYQGDVPPANSDNLAFRFNLWLFNASGSRSDTEVIVKDFEYVPATATSDLPEIAGMTNAASFSGEALAPCSLFSLFGANLTSETASASAIPLPHTLAGTKVLVNGIIAPLLFVSEGQINAQVPCNVLIGEASVAVQTANGTSAPESIRIAREAIGIFRYVDDACIVTDASFELITNERPARPGSLISVFVTGIGRVNPPIPTGEAAPTGAISPAIGAFEAHVDDRETFILFLGAAPGFVGVGQANLQLPEILPSGHRVLRIARSNGGIASTCLIPVGTAPLPPLGPVILSATPSSAVPGETVMIRGANFFGAVQVRFGAAFASSVVLVDSTTIRVTVPPGTGVVAVSARNPDGKQATLQNAFTYVTPTLSLTSVNPSSGPVGGLTTLRGTGFADGSTVFFGPNSATSVSVISASAIQATVPPGAGTVNVTVRNPDGQQSQLLDAFTYVAAPPVLTSISPASAIPGTETILSGSGINPGVEVRFGSSLATSVIVDSPARIRAIVPSGTGTVSVSVRNPDGQQSTLPNVFTYANPAPTLTSINPPRALAGGEVLVSGSNFVSGVQVLFGTVPAPSVVFDNSTSTRATVPQGSGTVNVSVRNPDGQQATLVSAFTYLVLAPTLSAISPQAALVGDLATITGSNFVKGAEVLFGSILATSVVSSSTMIRATVPAGTGTVSVSVRNPDGQQVTLSNAFTYLVPGPPSIQANVIGCRVQGQAQNVSSSTVRAVVYARTNMYYIQPCSIEPTQALRADRTFGPIDSHVGEIYVLLVAAGYVPPSTTTTLPTVDGVNVLDVKGPVGSVPAGCNVARCPAQ